MRVELATDKFVHAEIVEGKDRWWCSFVYSKPSDILKRHLRNELKNISYHMAGKWLLTGDFNDITSADEMKGGAPF